MHLKAPMKKLALALVSVFLASPAVADPATPQGADHLSQVFQTYLGPGADVISVVAKGDVYELTMDVQPLIAQATGVGGRGQITPIVVELADHGDSTWGVSMDQPIGVDLSIPKVFDLKEDIARFSLTGTFDETLPGFTQVNGAFSGIKLVETFYADHAPPQRVEASVDAGTIESTSRAAASGGTDFKTTLTATGVIETMTTPAIDGEPAMPVTIKAESLSDTVAGNRFMGAQMLELAAWMTAHPDKAAKEADQAGLKAALIAAMPFFGTMQGTGAVNLLSIDTPMGAMGIEKVGFSVDLNGAVPAGLLRAGFSVSGLTLPAGLVPDWAAPLAPQTLSLDVQATDFDPAAAVTAALSALDLPSGSQTGPEFDAKLQAALLPKGSVTITLNPGALTGAGYALTYEGAMVAGPNTEMPTGKATVTLTGAEALTAALNAAPDDMKAQAMMGFGMAQGMAKQQGDLLIWEIDAPTPGSLSINGMAMMGGN